VPPPKTYKLNAVFHCGPKIEKPENKANCFAGFYEHYKKYYPRILWFKEKVNS